MPTPSHTANGRRLPGRWRPPRTFGDQRYRPDKPACYSLNLCGDHKARRFVTRHDFAHVAARDANLCRKRRLRRAGLREICLKVFHVRMFA